MGKPPLRRNAAGSAAAARCQTAAIADPDHSGVSREYAGRASELPDSAIPDSAIPVSTPTENAAPESWLGLAGDAEVRNSESSQASDRRAGRQRTAPDSAKPDCANLVHAGLEHAHRKRVGHDPNPGAARSSDHDEGHAEGRDADHAWNRSSKAFFNTISSGRARGAV